MTENNKPKSNIELSSDNGETSAIGISLGLTALAAAVIYSSDISFVVRLICLVIFILGWLSTGFLYFTFLINKIPATMYKSNSRVICKLMVCRSQKLSCNLIRRCHEIG